MICELMARSSIFFGERGHPEPSGADRSPRLWWGYSNSIAAKLMASMRAQWRESEGTARQDGPTPGGWRGSCRGEGRSMITGMRTRKESRKVAEELTH